MFIHGSVTALIGNAVALVGAVAAIDHGVSLKAAQISIADVAIIAALVIGGIASLVGTILMINAFRRSVMEARVILHEVHALGFMQGFTMRPFGK